MDTEPCSFSIPYQLIQQGFQFLVFALIPRDQVFFLEVFIGDEIEGTDDHLLYPDSRKHRDDLTNIGQV